MDEPISKPPREIPLGDEVRAALKAHRHLRGPLVFFTVAGNELDTVATRGPLWFACKKAGLRQIGWHVLRHTFASHLVMRGATMTAAHVTHDRCAAPSQTMARGCAVGSDGSVAFTGEFAGQIDFGTGPLQTHGHDDTDAFIVLVDPPPNQESLP